jgi:hypothetical protein
MSEWIISDLGEFLLLSAADWPLATLNKETKEFFLAFPLDEADENLAYRVLMERNISDERS